MISAGTEINPSFFISRVPSTSPLVTSARRGTTPSFLTKRNISGSFKTNASFEVEVIHQVAYRDTNTTRPALVSFNTRSGV